MSFVQFFLCFDELTVFLWLHEVDRVHSTLLETGMEFLGRGYTTVGGGGDSSLSLVGFFIYISACQLLMMKCQ